MMYERSNKKVIALLGILSLAACTSAPPIDQVELMPAPDVYGDGLINPLPEYNPMEKIPYDGILFATDRKPASAGDEEKYYGNDRGRLLRVGVAQVKYRRYAVRMGESARVLDA